MRAFRVAEEHNDRGVSWVKRGKLEKAVPCFKQALKINPFLVQAHYNLGVVFNRQGKIKKAIDSS